MTELSSTAASFYTESILSSSDHSCDTLDELLSRFTLDFRPEYVLKLRNRIRESFIVGIDASHLSDTGETLAAVLLKPADQTAWWRRLRLSTSGNITLRSRKLHWWVITLDLEGTINPITGAHSTFFRVATKWDPSRGEYRNKKRLMLGEATEGRVHWHVNYNLPQLEGSFGTARGSGRGDRMSLQPTNQEMHAEVGYAHAEVSKLELVVWPMRNNPKWDQYSDIGQNNNDDDAPRNAHSKDCPNWEKSQKNTEQSADNHAVTLQSNWIERGRCALQNHIEDLQEWWHEGRASSD